MSGESTNGDYRQRLYDAYVRSGQAELIRDPSDLTARASHLRDFVARHFPRDRDARILELGCGSGALLYFAHAAGYRALKGVDASPEQIACAKSLGLDCVSLGDGLGVLADGLANSIDAVIAFDVIEHLGKNEVMRFFDAAHRVLSENGRLILHVPNAEGPFGGAIRYGDFTHEIAFTRRSIAQVAIAAGFARVDCYEDRPIPHGLKSTVRWILWPFVRLIFRALVAIETGDLARDAIFSRNLTAVIWK